MCNELLDWYKNLEIDRNQFLTDDEKEKILKANSPSEIDRIITAAYVREAEAYGEVRS